MSHEIKQYHEIRDPVHVFVRFSSDERRVIDTLPFQRLRYIHQLGTTYLVYPGATHRRFEHSLGVMELASRVFDVVSREKHERVTRVIPELSNPESLGYWRKALRLAALCHDLGHLPFSHAAEAELLPPEWNHERMTAEIIKSKWIAPLLEKMIPPVKVDHVVKLAIGPKNAEPFGYAFSPWESLLSEILVSDAFGVDRMDYLLRDSHHAGVVYGHFDHYRIIDSLRFLPSVPSEQGADLDEVQPALGITEGGLHSADAMLLARYFMFSQLYFHPIRRIYDIHLRDFLSLRFGVFSTELSTYLNVTDNEVTSAIFEAAEDPKSPAHDAAMRLAYHRHFYIVYRRREEDVRRNPEAARLLFEAACKEFGPNCLRHDRPRSNMGLSKDFPVLLDDNKVASSLVVSETLPKVPSIAAEFIFADRDKASQIRAWIEAHRNEVIALRPEDEVEEEKKGNA